MRVALALREEPLWLKMKRHYTAAKECFGGYRKRRASREGMIPSFDFALWGLE